MQRFAYTGRAAGNADGSTREHGVMALGDGNGQWVLVNMSPAVAHQLDSDAAADETPGSASQGKLGLALRPLSPEERRQAGGHLRLRRRGGQFDVGQRRQRRQRIFHRQLHRRPLRRCILVRQAHRFGA